MDNDTLLVIIFIIVVSAIWYIKWENNKCEIVDNVKIEQNK